MESSNPSISVVVPCYRSGRWLGELVDRLTGVLGEIPGGFEIILVNDGSGDDTWTVISELAARDGRVRGLDLMRNVGQFAALMCGLERARGDVVVTMDDDLQHAPEDIPSLVGSLTADPDLDAVVARYRAKRHNGIRNLGSAIMDRIFRRSYDKPAELRMSSFRALRRRVVAGMLEFGTARPVPGALLLQTTSRIVNVDVDHHDRKHGASGYRLSKLIAGTFDSIINSSTAPLQAIAVLGIGLSGFSLVLAAYYLVLGLVRDRPAPGFTTIVLFTVFFGGAILFAIGVLGEYVARIVAETTRPPRYLVRADTFDSDESD